MKNEKRSSQLFDPNAQKPFIITVSARSLFDLEDSHKIFVEQGEAAFTEYQRKREHVPLKPGAAYSFIKKLLDINETLPPGARPFEIVLLSRNSPETGMRVFNTVEKLKLNIIRAVFTSGTSVSRYISAIDADLFLSSNPEEVKKVMDLNIAAAHMIPRPFDHPEDNIIRIAFDGDGVIFGDEAERINLTGGLDEFIQHEVDNAHRPLPSGPLRGLLDVVHNIQDYFDKENCPIRTALVTARSMPAHKRALMTLRSWGIRIDEAMFLGGKDKTPYLEAFKADLFLDDSKNNIGKTFNSVPSGHVPHGIRNEEGSDDSKFSGGANFESTRKSSPSPK